jgi:hypothetical protein
VRPLSFGLDRTDSSAAAIAAGVGSLALLTLAAAIFGEDLAGPLFGFCLLVGAVAVFRPLFGVMAAVVAAATYGWLVVGPSISAFQLLVAAAAVGTILHHRREVLRLLASAPRIPELLAGGLFVGWIALAAVVRWGEGDLAYVRNFAGALVFMALVALLCRTARDRRLVVGAILLGASATALVGLVQLLTVHALVSAWVLPDLADIPKTYERLGAPWGLAASASNFGKDVLVGFLVASSLLTAWPRGRMRSVLWGVTALLAVALVMSGSRSTWLAAAAGLAWMVSIRREHRVVLAVLAMIAVLALCVIRPSTPVDVQGWVGLPSRTAPSTERSPVTAPGADRRSLDRPAQNADVAGQRDTQSTELSFELRRRLTKAGLLMVRDQPLFGVGPDVFRLRVHTYVRTTDIDPRPFIPAHNVLLEIWADSGTPALLAFVAFVIAVLLRLERQRRRLAGIDQAVAVGLAAAIVGLLVTYQFHNFAEDNFLWALCGLALSYALWPGAPARGPASQEPESAAVAAAG